MSRNSSGTMTLPSGNPVISGTDIESVWANTTLSDIAQEITNSLDRSGRGGMLAALKAFAGTQTAPGISWTLEPRSGIRRASDGDFRFVIDGVDVALWSDQGIASGIPMSIPPAGPYVLTITDRGKGIYKNDAANITIPPVSSVAYSRGTIISGVNDSASAQTLVAGSGVTLRLAGTTSTGNRTVAARGQWNAWMVADNLWWISGVGVS